MEDCGREEAGCYDRFVGRTILLCIIPCPYWPFVLSGLSGRVVYFTSCTGCWIGEREILILKTLVSYPRAKPSPWFTFSSGCDGWGKFS